MNNCREKLLIAILITILIPSIIYIYWINNIKTALPSVFIEDFKAVPNDRIDDTDQIQEAINHLNKHGGGVIKFQKGIYLVDAVKSIQLKDNITLEFKKGSILKALPNSAEGYEMLSIHDVKNIEILGAVKIIGERNEHLGVTGEWGIGISIKGSTGVHIEKSTITNCWGDGIYIGRSNKKKYSKNITIENVKFHNNRRQGISIISVINLKATNINVNNTNGTKPASGIDLEPNRPDEFLQNVEIVNLYTKNNQGYGLLFAIGRLSESENYINIKVTNTKNIKDNIGIFVPNRIKGKIKIGDEYILNTSR